MPDPISEPSDQPPSTNLDAPQLSEDIRAQQLGVLRLPGLIERSDLADSGEGRGLASDR